MADVHALIARGRHIGQADAAKRTLWASLQKHGSTRMLTLKVVRQDVFDHRQRIGVPRQVSPAQ